MQTADEPGNGRAAAAIIVVAVLAVVAAGNSWIIAKDVSKSSPDTFGVQLAAQRFSFIREGLTKGTHIAYLSDLGLKDLAGTTAFVAAQYALAPAFLVPVDQNSGEEWAVGNFTHPADFAAAGAQAGYQLVKDYGAGVILYRRAGQ